jgi:DNA (cytosine-5)-methyltransferase 1
MNIISFFSGCGGLDLGFKNAGFNIIWSNDNSEGVRETFEKNFPETVLNKKSIKKIDLTEIPDNPIGIIGGPPCQSWSVAGSGKGLTDKRGLLFFDFINIIEQKQPLFFVAENVEGLLSKKNKGAFSLIKSHMENAGYIVYPQILNAADYSVPQNRKRVFFVGYRYDIPTEFKFPGPLTTKINVKDAIYDLKDTAIPSQPKNLTNGDACVVPNHEYWQGSYSYIFMSRNRVLSWDKPSYTIQASGRQVSIHPQAPEMIKVAKDERIFVPGVEHLYRRLSIRECARIQTFPDDFIFKYASLDTAYKMIGNSVPVNLSNAIASVIYKDIQKFIEENAK